MNQDGGLPFDIEEILEVIDQTDVLVIGFPLFPERLMVDFRFADETGPLVRVVPPVASRAERLRELARLRPDFGVPNQHVFFVWPRSLASFRESGIWEEVVNRMEGSGDPRARANSEAAMNDLRALERKALIDAVSGESYQSLWERSR